MAFIELKLISKVRRIMPGIKAALRGFLIALGFVGLLFPMAPPSLDAQTAKHGTPVISDADLYYGAFHHVAVLKAMADAAQKQGKDRSNLRQIVRQQAGLTALEGQILEKIALQCESDISAQDATAKAIIDQFHAQYPPGAINPSFSPQAPPELDALWTDRQNIVLSARNNLRSMLGEDSFAKFDQFARKSAQPVSAAAPSQSSGQQQ